MYKFNCSQCGKEVILNIDDKSLEEYSNGKPLKDFFPNLSNQEQESFVTCLCEECLKKNKYPKL